MINEQKLIFVKIEYVNRPITLKFWLKIMIWDIDWDNEDLNDILKNDSLPQQNEKLNVAII